MTEKGHEDAFPRPRLSDEMVHFVGLDVSVKATSVCVVDDAGKVILEQKVPTDPADIIAT
jgi:predicted NBD/HSP70 family sugar kinase